MTNVISLEALRSGAMDHAAPAPSDGADGAVAVESTESSCIRAAAALAEACADWSIILLHRPTRQAMALLAEARLLIRDLLVVGGIAPQHAGSPPSPTPQELTARIRRLRESALALGAIIQPGSSQ